MNDGDLTLWRSNSEAWQCPLCGCHEAERLFVNGDVTGGTSRVFAVVQCRQCGLHSLNPRPQRSTLLSFYPQDYEPLWTPLQEEKHGVRRWLHRRHWAIRCRAVRHAMPRGGQILDLGCATGLFLAILEGMARWQGVGLDINKRALAVARRQGVYGICGEAGRLGLPSHAFDVVTAWDVIEHVPDPVSTMAEIYRVLKPGGSLLLSTPNSQAYQVRLWGRHWAGWDVPRHLQVFSYRTLYRLLERTHFVVTQRLSFPTERFYAVESARRYLEASQGGVAKAILKRLASFLGIAAWPIWRWMDQTKVASSIVLEARAIKNALT